MITTAGVDAPSLSLKYRPRSKRASSVVKYPAVTSRSCTSLCSPLKGLPTILIHIVLPCKSGGLLEIAADLTPGRIATRLRIARASATVCGSVAYGVRRRDIERRQAIGSKAEIHIEQMVEAPAEQPGADEQHHGDGQFEHDKSGAESPPRRPRRAAAAFGQAFAALRQR